MNFLKKRLRQLVLSYINPHLPQFTPPETLISKAARFVACEMIEGDYLEFGVYRGDSFIAAYKSLKKQFQSRIAQKTGGNDEAVNKNTRQRIWQNMRFFAFDSFQGLPALTAEDSKSLDFQEGQYACSADRFSEIVLKAGVPSDVMRLVPGWFSDSCNAETLVRHQIQRAAIVWIDCDLYSSTKSVLEFITPLLQDGTIIIFDDWYSYRGSPYAGEQRAFYEWLESISSTYSAQEYQKEKWKRCSFVISQKNIPESETV